MSFTDLSAVPVSALVPGPEGERLTSLELVISNNGLKVPFDSVTNTGTSPQASTRRVHLMIRVQPPGPVEREEFGLKDAFGSALKKESILLAHGLFGLGDAIGVTLRSMSLHGKRPAFHAPPPLSGGWI